MSEQLWLFALIGFVAQFIKGSMGMGFGIITSSALLSLGLPPTVVSASVHTAELGTTSISAVSHLIFRNVDFALLPRLIIPGIIGSVIGAYVLTLLPVKIARPIIAVYLLIMGCIILYRVGYQVVVAKSLRSLFNKHHLKHDLPSDQLGKSVLPLAAMGGFFDAAGGGGWGQIMTSSLLAKDATPHYTIGTVNTAQIFVALSSAIIFYYMIGISHLPIILALLVGGVLTAPIAAYFVRRIHPNLLSLLAGILVVTLSTRILILTFV